MRVGVCLVAHAFLLYIPKPAFRFLLLFLQRLQVANRAHAFCELAARSLLSRSVERRVQIAPRIVGARALFLPLACILRIRFLTLLMVQKSFSPPSAFSRYFHVFARPPAYTLAYSSALGSDKNRSCDRVYAVRPFAHRCTRVMQSTDRRLHAPKRAFGSQSTSQLSLSSVQLCAPLPPHENDRVLCARARLPARVERRASRTRRASSVEPRARGAPRSTRGAQSRELTRCGTKLASLRRSTGERSCPAISDQTSFFSCLSSA